MYRRFGVRLATILIATTMLLLCLSLGVLAGEPVSPGGPLSLDEATNSGAHPAQWLDLGTLDRPDIVKPYGGRLASQLEALTRDSQIESALGVELAAPDQIVDGRVLVAVYRETGSHLSGVQSLESAGLVVDKTRDEVVQGWAPVDRLTEIAQSPGVRLVRPANYARPLELSEGTTVIGSGPWTAAGMTGLNTTVAIIDTSFDGYGALLGTDLPSSVETHSSRADHLIEVGSAHGTGCAEIVHDVAPGAILHLIAVATDIDLQDAVAYVRGYTLDIVSCSIGWEIGGPGDGTGPINEVVGAATLDEILWVQAAGNEAHRHWMGPWRDADDDGWGENELGEERNRFYVPETTDVTVSMRWDETWGEAEHEFALLVYDTMMMPVGYTTTTATAPGDPTRMVRLSGLDWGYYYIAFQKLDREPFEGQVEIFAYPYGLDTMVNSERSIVTPGDAEDVLTIGAVPWYDTESIEYFSSRGPTTDERIKPDLVGPDQISCVSYSGQPSGFVGTSAAAPHGAGAASVLWAMYPAWTMADIVSYLTANALDLGDAGADNTYGSGLLNMGPPPATPTPTATSTSTPTMYATPSITNIFTPTPSSTPTITPTLTSTVGPVRCVLPLILRHAYTSSTTPTPGATLTMPPTIPLPTSTATSPATIPPPTLTGTPTATSTATVTLTASATATSPPTIGPSPTATATPTRTVTPTPTATEPPTGCWESVTNGGFEDDSIWLRAPGPHMAEYVTSEYHSGLRACRMGIEPPEIEMASSSSIVQIVAIPSDAITATLSFWAWRGTEESGGSGELAGVKWRPSLAGVNLDALTYDDDVQEIILFTQDAPGDPWDTVLQEVEREKRTDAGWVESSYDLTPHVGKSVMLYINVFNDGSDGRTWMYVDDVSLEICR